MMSDKIRQHHLDRRAILYVHQSSSHQSPPQSREPGAAIRMRERLVTLGWSEIEIIDDDLELNGQPGELHLIDSVTPSTNTITLVAPIAAPADFPLTAGLTDPAGPLRQLARILNLI